MAERHEEKYLITYQQYAQLKERAMQTMVPDVHGVNGSYMITSLYYDDPMGNSLLEKLAGQKRHSQTQQDLHNGQVGIKTFQNAIF